MHNRTKSLLTMSLLAASLLIPSVNAFADHDDPPGNHRQREELRRDRRRLDELRQRRAQERREGDWRSAREYDEKIRDQRREIWQDRRDIYGRDRYGYRWDRDRHHDWHRD